MCEDIMFTRENSPGISLVFIQQMIICSKWFEPRGISSSYCVIVRVRVVLKRTAAGD